MVLLTCESKAELLGPDVFFLDSAEQRLHLHYEQIRTVLPGFGHGADVLQKGSKPGQTAEHVSVLEK